ncbi:hypothetical protein TVAG_401710 [Trichomonas vaginalis G3]|uniref:DUF3447 domain-containing protein n=1 Tax=Trichomonas vaginalis (strain ATCC PRA-98 / G3) TaxID=412133 RepID=A2EGD7_TRIV3|nr:spectrin binding [Trichomonas vaginalis G3]EAY08316.1 hypothetical protein TVAG_401710 [Trichomonas vaginalis G3]KAI5546083.1 spectrin binding [Trichomonas vaginalis G3]|eukprot:XP_001320539.1 hypothetical protein [Trichomonas vaginalis G3]
MIQSSLASDYSKQYADFIEAFEKLFQIKYNESIEDICNIITNVLITKYKLSIKQLKKIILMASQYNYSSRENYIRILEHIGADFSKIQASIFPMEDSIEFIVMHDQIDKFKEYITQKRIELDLCFLRIPDISNTFHSIKLSLIEACAYFGSVNIFHFLLSNQICEKTQNCLHCSIIGRNTDIINECLKDYEINIDCLKYIVSSHNNEMLEYVIENKDFVFEEWIQNIKTSELQQNLKEKK